jgi:hypothetical protein
MLAWLNDQARLPRVPRDRHQGERPHENVQAGVRE